ncbi:phage portal protein [Gordonia rubripertincta]|uniref:Phage portal protein n=1 Tax=Gordonia rubripertincta TaxID=36822 RepID=A0AAW4G9G2_GORRU|nr:phage portal protein [Gordonia rubripertincta]MBM7280356.1 phage portal protein [Gordonia rubripertincta]
MNREQALSAVRDMLAGPRAYEAERLDALAAAVRPWSRDEALARLEIKGVRGSNSDGSPWAAIAGLAQKSQTNLLPLVLDIFSQSLKVDNYLSGLDPNSQPDVWEWWQRNKMDARQTGIHRTALHYGVAYATVLPAMNPQLTDNSAAYIRGVSPRQMTALYGDRLEWDPRVDAPVDDDWPMMALEMNGSMVRFYDEKSVHFIGVETVPHSALGWKELTYSRASNFKYLESRAHGVGVCPVVRFEDRNLLDGEQELRGVIEPLLQVQSRIDETTFEMLVAQYYSAFVQRYVMGWMPQSQEQALRQAVSDTWFFESDKVKVGQFDAADLKGYLESAASAKRDLAALGQVPAQNLGIDGISNISEATLAGLEASKDRKEAEIKTSLGESHEQVMRTCAYIVGDEEAAGDFASEVKWQDMTARTFAQVVDGLGKLAQMLNVPAEALWEDIPGWTSGRVERAKDLADSARRQSAVNSVLGGVRNAAQVARQDPTVNDLAARRTDDLSE